MARKFKALIQKQVRQVFNKHLGDLADEVTYKSLTKGHDPSTLVVTPSETTATVKGKFVRDNRKEENAASKAPEGLPRKVDPITTTFPTIRFLCPVSSLGAITPKKGDQIIRSGGETWTVEDISKDPSDALYSFTLRRP